MSCSSEQCNWIHSCSECEIALTYHHDTNKSVCHNCGKSFKSPKLCPVCSSSIRLSSFGSKSVEEELATIIPPSEIIRIDTDSDYKKSSLESVFQEIAENKFKVIIGTQQVVKGLDLPSLSLVGILNADLSLNFPDYSSQEKTFQLICQAVGRVGRGHTKNPKVIIQTSQPDSPLLKMSAEQDWHKFFDEEIEIRKNHGFPPYKFFAKLIARGKSIPALDKKLNQVKSQLNVAPVKVIGPLDCFYSKKGEQYYKQLIVSSNSRGKLVNAIKTLNDMDFKTVLDPSDLL